ncbi:MAG: hypothetical protein QOJ86_4159 [Bradyrhizobium sp.]|nr:hypothetical protein [Bradyrhizobium sp.]
MRVFKTKSFVRFARRERISDKGLAEAVRRAERGLVDASLGGGLIKQRVARPGQGRSGGYRVVLAWRVKARTVFLFGFAKSERDNIDDDELATLQDVGRQFLEATDTALTEALAKGALLEVMYDEDD